MKNPSKILGSYFSFLGLQYHVNDIVHVWSLTGPFGQVQLDLTGIFMHGNWDCRALNDRCIEILGHQSIMGCRQSECDTVTYTYLDISEPFEPSHELSILGTSQIPQLQGLLLKSSVANVSKCSSTAVCWYR